MLGMKAVVPLVNEIKGKKVCPGSEKIYECSIGLMAEIHASSIRLKKSPVANPLASPNKKMN